MGEHASSFTTFLPGNMLTIRAENSLSPGEKRLESDQQNWSLLQELKNQEFAKVKSLLKERLEAMAGCNVLNLSSIVEPDGSVMISLPLAKMLKADKLRERRKNHET